MNEERKVIKKNVQIKNNTTKKQGKNEERSIGCYEKEGRVRVRVSVM